MSINKTLNKNEIIKVMGRYGMAPIKKLGQNFLIDETISKKIVKELEISNKDIVLEIGPGFGALTGQLVKQAQHLDVYEIDRKMVGFLKDKFQNLEKINIIHEDGLKANFSKYDRIISNLPYYLTSEFIERLYQTANNAKKTVVMIQKDAYQRITSQLGEKGYGPTSLMLDYLATIKKVFDVSKTHFHPIPAVDSTVISIVFNKNKYDQKAQHFEIMLKGLFVAKRKTILNNLLAFINDKDKSKHILEQLKIDSKKRPENITLQEYLKIYEIIA